MDETFVRERLYQAFRQHQGSKLPIHGTNGIRMASMPETVQNTAASASESAAESTSGRVVERAAKWRGFGVLAVLAITVAAFLPAAEALFTLWMDSDRPYSHGGLVALAGAWMLVRALRANGVHDISSAGSWLALLLFGGATLVWLMARAADILVVQEALLPPLLVLAVAALFGWRMSSKVLFPVFFVYFAIPLWSVAVPALQALTVAFARVVFDLARVPVYVEGNVVTIPEGAFEIAAGCAGLHYFIVSLTISSLYGYLHFRRLSLRVLLVLLAAVLAMVTNWVRVSSLIALGHATRMQHPFITEGHYWYGWILFCAPLAAIFLVGRFLAARDSGSERDSVIGGTQDAANTQLGTSGVAGAANAGNVDQARSPIVTGAARRLLVPVFCVILCIPVLAAWSEGGDGTIGPPPVLPSGAGAWTGPVEAVAGDWKPRFVGVDSEILGRYARGESRVDVYVGVYRRQSQGRELIGSGNRLAGAGYTPLASRLIPLPQGESWREMTETVAGVADGDRRVIWHVFAAGGRFAATELETKAWQLVNGLIGVDSGAVIAFSTVCRMQCGPDETRVLEDFAAEMGKVVGDLAVGYQRAGAGSDISSVSGATGLLPF